MSSAHLSFRHFTYVTAHFPTLPSPRLRHSSFSNPYVASPTSQLFLQTLFSLLLCHRLFTCHLASRPCNISGNESLLSMSLCVQLTHAFYCAVRTVQMRHKDKNIASSNAIWHYNYIPHPQTRFWTTVQLIPGIGTYNFSVASYISLCKIISCISSNVAILWQRDFTISYRGQLGENILQREGSWQTAIRM